ncbi:MAG: hypothetical protein HC880_04610 [Bacteroidia bacterium]|nr:hypothetical protein [Bacteroidia bacterium]
MFFRNGKPFTRGEEVVGRSDVLPHPSVVWGAMYTTLLVHKLVEKEKSRG